MRPDQLQRLISQYLGAILPSAYTHGDAGLVEDVEIPRVVLAVSKDFQ